MHKCLKQYFSLLIACFCFFTSVVFAESENYLKKVELIVSDSQNQIVLIFDKTYQGTVSPHFDSGIIQVGFPNTEFDTVENIRVNNGFLRNIYFSKENQKTIMQVLFADSTYKAIGQISYTFEQNKIFFNISKTKEKFEEQETGELEESLKKELLPSSKLDKAYSSQDLSTVNIVKMLLTLLLVLALIYSFLWFYKKFFVSRINLKKGRYNISVSSAFHISPKQKIIILEINEKAYACGVTQDNITVISKVSDSSFSQFITGYSVEGVSSIDFSALKEQFETYKSKKQEVSHKVKQDKPLKFADELLTKVKQLKPID